MVQLQLPVPLMTLPMPCDPAAAWLCPQPPREQPSVAGPQAKSHLCVKRIKPRWAWGSSLGRWAVAVEWGGGT